jgi:hypothetical protein
VHAPRLRGRAWRIAGIDPGTAARFQAEHRALRASGETLQRAAEVLDVEERMRLMRGIAALYGLVHSAAPDELIWSGFAAIAVNDGVLPATEIARLAVRMTEEVIEHPVLARAGRLGRRLYEIAGFAEDALKCAFETNYAIFADLGWVHLAYLEGGIAVLERLAADGELDPSILAGFAEIDRGARIGGEDGERAISGGNLALFRREQAVAVTPIFSRYRGAMAFASRVGLISVPNEKIARRAEALGRRSTWTEVHGRAESYGPFSARWRWLVDHAWTPMIELHRARSGALQDEVDRAVEGRPEHVERLTLGRGALSVATLWSSSRSRSKSSAGNGARASSCNGSPSPRPSPLRSISR